MQRALIFDFDGTMLDTEWPAFQAWKAIFDRHGATLALRDWVTCVGSGAGFDPLTHLAAQLPGIALDRDAILAERLADKVRRIGDSPPMPGVLDRIREAQALGWRLAVASSSPAAWVLPHLDRLAVRDLFDAVRTRDDVAHAKPAPDLFLSAAAALGLPPACCVVFEDSLNGVRAARAAGMMVIAVPNRVTQQLDFREAHLQVSSLDAISLRGLPQLSAMETHA